MSLLRAWLLLLVLALQVGFLLFAGLTGCVPAGPDARAGQAAALVDGDGVVLSFAQHIATWVTIRSSPESRANGWNERLSKPALVVYNSRGFNPVFTRNSPIRVAWLDGDRVVRIEDAPFGARFVSPTQEITAALVVPEGFDTGLRVGDRVMVVAGRP